MPLLERDDSILIVIDLQPEFWSDRLVKDDAASEQGGRPASWLAGTAMALGCRPCSPRRLGAQRADGGGGLLAVGRQGAGVHQAGLRSCRLPGHHGGDRATGRRTAVLCGFETDVCVTHSAAGLAEAGYRVVVAVDAVYSPAGAQAFGLARLRDLGVELVHCKGIYYDWVRTLDEALAFEREHPDLAEPPGFWI